MRRAWIKRGPRRQRLRACWSTPPGAALLIIVLVLASWLPTHLFGGADVVPPLWGFLPVFIAGARFGPVGAAVAAAAAGVVAGPLTPANVASGAPQSTSDWLLRTGFFLGIGLFVSVIVVRAARETAARAQAEALAAEVAERKRAEEALHLSEESFRLLFETNPHPMWVWDMETRHHLAANDAAVDYYGYSHEEFLRMAIIDLQPAEDREGGLKRLEHVRPGTPFAGHARHQLKDGRIIHVDITGRHQQFHGRPAFVALAQDVTEKMALEAELRHKALYDPLTGLANRALFRDRVEHALAGSAREMTSVAVLLLDLDRFKVVNDTLGHAAGDEIIVAVAQRLRGALRPGDTPAHIGGDEFAVLLPGADAEQASRVAERTLQALRAPVDVAGSEVFTSASIGVAIHAGFGGYLGEVADVDGLLSRADVAMYTAKSGGRGGFQLYEPAMHHAALRRMELGADLRRAVQREEFDLEYQPVVALADDSAGSLEALIRWQHPERGLIPPADFITAAEETGLIVPIGAWVLRTACRQAVQWQADLPVGRRPSISVNVSARQLSEPNFTQTVLEALHSTGLSASKLILEVTESVVLQDMEATCVKLRELRAEGVRIALDDFGAGYSSLGYLRNLPLDIIKIDRMFVAGLGSSGEDRALTLAIVRLLSTVDARIVAEGIESLEQLAYVHALGVDAGQGYYFSRPVTGSAVRHLLGGPMFDPSLLDGTGDVACSRAGAVNALAALATPSPIHIAIADENADLRLLLRSMLEYVGGFEVVGEASNADEAVEVATAARPDVMLIDLPMAVMDGRRTLQTIRSCCPSTKLLLLSAVDPPHVDDDASGGEVDAYLAKGAQLSDLVRLLRDLHRHPVRAARSVSGRTPS